MYDLPHSALLRYSESPIFQKVSMANIPFKDMVKELKATLSASKNQAKPTHDALSFYYFNHASHILKLKYGLLTPLPLEAQNIAEHHLVQTNEISKRLFFYTWMIIRNQIRYFDQSSQSSQFYDNLEQAAGTQFKDWIKEGCRGNSIEDSLSKLNQTTTGQAASGLVSVFSFGVWPGYAGGRVWAPIPSLLADCVYGRTSLANMGDQTFSLCHHGGTIFDKPFMYRNSDSDLFKVLDVQDSGQIPKLVDEIYQKSKTSQALPDAIIRAHAFLSSTFPEEFSGKVDPALVKNSTAKREHKRQQQMKTRQNYINQLNKGTAPGQVGKNKIEEKRREATKMDQIIFSNFK